MAAAAEVAMCRARRDDRAAGKVPNPPPHWRTDAGPVTQSACIACLIPPHSAMARPEPANGPAAAAWSGGSSTPKIFLVLKLDEQSAERRAARCHCGLIGARRASVAMKDPRKTTTHECHKDCTSDVSDSY